MIIQAEVYMRSVLQSYREDGTSSRTTPCTTLPQLNVGDWMVHPFKMADGYEAEQLCYVPLWMVHPIEDDVPTNNEGRGDDSIRYEQWMNEGMTAPPIMLYQQAPSGRLAISDGHRRYYAAKRRGDTHILAWVSWLVWQERSYGLAATGSTIEWVTSAEAF